MAMILIALIHNNNQERMASCREVVSYLQNELGAAHHKVEVKEFWEQEPIRTASRLSWLRARLRSARSQYAYMRFHLRQSPRAWLPYLIGSLDIIQFLFCTKEKLRAWEIEKIVTEKHVSAWDAGSRFDFTIVVEDDAVLGENLASLGPTLRKELVNAIQLRASAYFDIAGGYPLDLVAPKGFNFRDGMVSVATLFTNTACVYGINKFLSRAMSDAVNRTPKLRWLGVDFLINAIFQKIQSPGSHCVHFTTEAIQHGSMNGKYKSWTKE